MKKYPVIKTTRDIVIVVGVFYKSIKADGYFYVGAKLGSRKRLICLNPTKNDINRDVSPSYY